MSFEREKISYIVGIRIRDFRTTKNMSQEALALSSGIHPAYMGRIERGEKCPSIDTIYKICKGLKIPLSELLDITMDVKPSNIEAMHRINTAMTGLSDEEAIRIAEIIENILRFKE